MRLRRKLIVLGVFLTVALAVTVTGAATAPGTITTVVGIGQPGDSGDGGAATQAQFQGVNAIAFDRKGNMYLADASSERVRKIDPSGIITTFAGTGVEGSTGDGGPATKARMRAPYDVAVDEKGNVYIPDAWDNRVRKVSPNGIITTFAGNGKRRNSGDGGPATKAGIRDPTFVAVDSKGNVYVASDYQVRKISTKGTITTFAGTGKPGGSSGDGIPARKARLRPTGMTFDQKGNLLIADIRDERLRKVTARGIITTVAGSGRTGFGGDGGPARKAKFRGLDDVAVDSKGTIYVTDFANSRVRKIGTNGIITTIVGNGKTDFSEDGLPATQTSLWFTNTVAIGPNGNIYFSDYELSRIRMIVSAASARRLESSAPKTAKAGITGACNRQTALKLANKHAYGEPFGHPGLQFICGPFTGPGSIAMAGIYHSGTCLPWQGFAVFHRVAGIWKQLMPLTDFGVLKITRIGSTIKETSPVFNPGDFRCNPSGGEHSRTWRWNGKRMVAGAWSS